MTTNPALLFILLLPSIASVALWAGDRAARLLAYWVDVHLDED